MKEIEKPVPNDDEVLIKVFAVSINDWDWQMLQGTPFVNRLLNGLFKPKKQILGTDIAGQIEAVGKSVKQFKPGDDVYGDLSGGNWGGFAEYACARENEISLKPASMTFEQAASIPQAAMLAVQGLIDKGQIQKAQKLLINGAGGGVGTFGLQIAKLYDAEVTGVDNTGKLDFMRSLGFDHVIDYTKEDFTKTGKRYDLILDVKTNRSIFKYVRALRPNGIYATVGGSTIRLIQALLLSPLIKQISKRYIRIVALKQNKDLASINEHFDAGRIKPVLDKTFSLDELPEALKHFGKGEHKGKVLIIVNR